MAVLEWATEQPLQSAILLAGIAYLSYLVHATVSNLLFHPLSKFPGPKLAAITTWRKALIECVVQRSWHTELEHLHSVYGPVVRIGPNELHFEDPQAYLDIYNNANRWDKEEKLYHSFGEDRSSFGFLTYKESRERKDVLNKSFSASAIQSASGLVVEKVTALCDVFAQHSKSKEPADLNWAFRCMTMDVITYLCFGNSVDAIHAPKFKAPILVAMDASMPVFVMFKHFTFYKNMIMGCPPKLSKIMSPPTAGLVDLQQILGKQITELVEDPSNLQNLPHDMTIYHALMDPEMHKSGRVPSAGSLYEEAQALMFAGADTVGNTLMVTIFHLMHDPKVMQTLKAELKAVWPDKNSPSPSLRELEKLPFLNAVIKEGLRLNSGVISGLPRIVPQTGAKISNVQTPGGAIVSCGSTFVHYNANLFPEPTTFKPERWVGDSGAKLEPWLVPFSRGPRSCLGINLAWLELRFGLAYAVRKFDFAIAPGSPETLTFRECFLPDYGVPHLKAIISPAAS